MPAESSGEVMLTLTRQEAKTKEKEQANYGTLIERTYFSSRRACPNEPVLK